MGIVYDIKARLSRIEVIVKGKRRNSNEYLNSIKNIHKGERCFVLGNEPSLKGADLDKLVNEVSFASNRIYKIFPETKWRPTYFGMIDEGVMAKPGVIDGVNGIKCEKKFFFEESYYIAKKITGDHCFLHSIYTRKNLNNPHFSDNLTKKVYSIATVTYMHLQIAAYMGFEKIYLLGVDNSYGKERDRNGNLIVKDGGKSYFGIQDCAENAVVGDTWESNIAFEYADKYSREHGFRIYNATRGGALECFERVDFDSLF